MIDRMNEDSQFVECTEMVGVGTCATNGVSYKMNYQLFEKIG